MERETPSGIGINRYLVEMDCKPDEINLLWLFFRRFDASARTLKFFIKYNKRF
jgi:hypothetical protein